MSLPTSYMTGGYGKIPQYFDTLLTARAPDKFTQKFFADLGFTSSTDRLFVNVLKSIGFIDESGVPTERYFKFLDQSNSKKMVAIGVKEAYVDLFNLNVSAYNMTQADVEGKFKTLTNGSKSSNTIVQMAKTFLALCSYAEWTDATASDDQARGFDTIEHDGQENVPEKQPPVTRMAELDLNYDIHIHLPATRDQAVYDALFASLAKHISLK
ncbi:MAG: DUF5343 domain-containing protein [Oscillospiraceae bacterium]|nr:DUF5343 domain-containing protein [Oscillospiraceae bacterium]